MKGVVGRYVIQMTPNLKLAKRILLPISSAAVEAFFFLDSRPCRVDLICIFHSSYGGRKYKAVELSLFIEPHPRSSLGLSFFFF